MNNPQSGVPPTTPNLSDIATRPSVLTEPAALFQRYGRAIHGYLVALLGEDAAAEVLSDLTVKIYEHKFERWSPDSGRGQFRYYLKSAVFYAALDHRRRRHGRAQQLADPDRLADDQAERPEVWLKLYRQAVLDAALAALKGYQDRKPGNVFHTLVSLLLRHRETDARELSAEELCRLLETATGRPYQPANVRKQKERARRKFAELLLDEVRQTLAEPTPQTVEEELQTLGLKEYLADFLPAGGSADADPGALAELTKVQARAGQVVRLRQENGWNAGQIAEALGLSEKEVQSDLRFAEAWLRQHRQPRDA